MDQPVKTRPSPREMEARIEQAMAADRHRLTATLRRVQDLARRKQPFDRNLDRLIREVDESVERRKRRLERLPRPSFPAELPISARREEIAEAIREHQVVVVAGETGSGKSTQLPKILLDLGYGVDGLIGHTQPRRLAARSLARRISDELGSRLGGHVGYKVRFTDETGPDTYVKLMTDGILLAELAQDRSLSAYQAIIIDEAHERSLNIDFLLGYLKQLLPRRRDLKLIVTSATINPQQFAHHFKDERGGPSPVIEVSGRVYPVDVRYRPITVTEATEEGEATRILSDPDERKVQQAIAAGIDEVGQVDSGDVLVFLPTERDIRETAKYLRSAASGFAGRSIDILPLYARLTPGEQDRVFSPSGDRKRLVLATNVAETSLTVPGIRHVIDTGTARISRYAVRSGVQRLPIEPISQASADQRKGRCGRLAPGVCIRLYSEGDYAARERYTPPEILRTNLASVILQMKAMRLGDVRSFPFVEPPKPAAIRDGYDTLFELGAIDDTGELTPLGRKLAQLPVDPRIGRMILAADRENVLAEVLIIASLLELQDPRLRPPEQQGAADAAHARYNVPGSDFLAILKLWERYHELKESSSRSALPRACAQEFLSFTRLREWTDVHRQLRKMVEAMGMRTSDSGHAPGDAQPSPSPSLRGRGAEPAQARADAVHRALLTGLLSHVAFRTEKYEYTGTGGKKFYLWPGSSLFEERPKWIVAAELVETNRLYGRTIASINPDWLERLGSHLVKKHHSEPRWDPTHGRVSANERVTLLGLTVVPRRTVHFGPIDPVASREMFINHALVLGEWNPPHRAKFWEHNLRMIEQVEALEAKTRTRDLLVDEAARYAFYDRRVPQGVVDVASFEKWRHEAERANPRILFMTEADLLSKEAPQGLEAFPDHVTFDGVKLPLEYHLEPGSEEDGVTVLCPLPALGQVDAKRLDWVVPGLLLEKVTELIRAMPKGLRKAFVPAPDVAAKVVARLAFAEGELHEAISRVLKDLTGVEVPREAYAEDALPHHLRMNVRVLDNKGNVLAQGRDIVKIRAQLGVEAAASFAEDASDERYTRDGVTAWDFGELPAQVRVRRAGLVMTAYPTLIDKGGAVSLRLVDAPTRAAAEHRRGLRRLFALQVAREVKYHVEQSVPVEAVALQMSGAVAKADLKAQAIDLVIDRAFLWDDPAIRDEAAFQERLDTGWNRIADAAAEVGQRLKALASAYHQAALAVAKAPDAPQLQASLLDVRAQLSTLAAPGFVATTPYMWLVQYPRYLGGAQLRVQKLLNGGASKDGERMAEFAPLWRQYLDRRNSHERQGIVDEALVTYRWMLEELRVSLFAQELGTSIPVSRKRLEKQWDRVRA